ncbi:MAG: terminase small subunit [Burkholderiales bacterium]
MRQSAFLAAYIELGNASAAYRRAYTANGMKPTTVNRKAKELLDNGKIRARLAETRSQAASTVQVNLERILFENARIAFADIRRILTPDGNVKPPAEWDDDIALAVASYELVPTKFGTSVKVKMADKGGALDRLGRHFGMYEKDNRQKAGALDDLPRDVAKLILDRLRGLNRPVVN